MYRHMLWATYSGVAYFLANLEFLCRVSIGDVRQTVDSRKDSAGTFRQFLDDRLFCTRQDPTLV